MKNGFILRNSVLSAGIIMVLFCAVACKKDKKATLPTVETVSVADITSSSAKINIKVSDDGGATVTAVGACWAKTANPDLSSNVSNVGQGTGDFISILSGLDPSTTYHVRAFATNEAGTTYGADMSFTTLN